MVKASYPLMVGIVLALLVGGPSSAQGASNCTPQRGQLLIDQGRYKQAISEFTCAIEAHPTDVEGYRGRIEAQLLLGQYSNSVRDYARVTAVVTPVHPDAQATILNGYAARLQLAPNDISALTGGSFARWWYFDYLGAINVLNQLLDVDRANVYGNLFRGSSRLLKGHAVADGVVDLEYAIALAPGSPDVHYIVADAYTYGLSDPNSAFSEASFALEGGLDTPRVHAILGSAYLAFGDVGAAATHIQRHIELVTTQLLATPALTAGAALAIGLVPGQTLDIPLPVNAGDTISIVTSSRDYWDTILVLLDPNGMPVLAATIPGSTSPLSIGRRRRAAPTACASRFSRASSRARCACCVSKTRSAAGTSASSASYCPHGPIEPQSAAEKQDSVSLIRI
jgi:tetratricopeptide (TPR) repeat protein